MLTRRAAWAFSPDTAREVLLKHFGTATLEGFGFDDADTPGDSRRGRRAGLPGRNAKGVACATSTAWCATRPASTLEIDAATRRSLEITATLRDGRREGSLLGVIDRTRDRDGFAACWPTGWPIR